MVIPAEELAVDRLVEAIPPSSRRNLSLQAFKKYESARTRTVWAKGHLRRFALVENDRILATADQCDLSGTLDGQRVAISGVGAMWSDPSGDRAAHCCSLLVDRLIERARRGGASLALICTAHGTPFALPRNFEPVPLLEADLVVAESARHGAPMTLVRSGEDRDLAAIAAMGRAQADRVRFHLDRDPDLIKHAITRSRLLAGLAAPGRRQLEFVIAEEGITAAAYLVISVAAGTWTVEECGDRDPSGARVGALLQALIAREPAESRPRIRGWLPPGFCPPQVAISSAQAADPVLFACTLSAQASPLQFTHSDVLFWHADLF